jgi:hypothetical protein
MVQNAATATIPESYLIPALGLEIASPDLTELQSHDQLFSIDLADYYSPEKKIFWWIFIL